MALERSEATAVESETGPPSSTRGTRSGGDRRTIVRPLLWRLHFLGGVLAAPIVLSLAITGILYAWNPQIEQALYRDALTAVAEGPARPLSQQVAAAAATHPGWNVVAITPAAPGAPGGEQTTGVTLAPPSSGSNEFAAPDGAVTVYVDPASAAVTGHIVEANRPDEWLRNLHSSWRLGPVAEPLTELAASWVLVSLLTGLYLWWPRNRTALRRALRLRRPGRPRWRTVHGLLGVGIFVGLALLVVTGLTWTTYAGKWIDLARSQLQSGAPSVSTQLAPSGSGHHAHGSHADSGGSGAAGESGTAAQAPAVAIGRVAATARQAGLTGVVRFSPPTGPGQAWTASIQDRRWPIETTTVAINPATGRVIDRVGWSDHSLLAKATTLGIAYHEATLFGLANQIGLTLLAVALIVLIISGYRTWWLRRPTGSLGLPPRTGPLWRTVPIPLLLGFGVLMVLLPVLGVSFLVYLIVERLIRLVRTRSARHAAR